MTSSALLEPGVEAVFVPGSPARTGRLAVWRPPGEARPATGSSPPAREGADTLTLALPAGSTVRRRAVPVTWVPISEAVDVLADLPASAACGPSVHAWADATRDALGLVARGRIVPACDDAGHDTWRLGPLDPADAARRFIAAAALPPAAHARAHDDARPVRITSAQWLLDRFGDAVADAYVRTAAAAVAAGHTAFAAGPPTAVAGQLEWLGTTSRGATAAVAVSLRLEEAPPGDDRGDPSRGDGTGGDDADDGPGFVGVLQVASRADPSLVLDAADLWVAPETIAARVGADAETAVLLALRRGSRVWSPLGRLLDQARPDRLALDGVEVGELLGPVADALAGAGIEVLWPRDVMATLETRPTVASDVVGADSAAGLRLDTLCTLRWRATVGGEELTDAELDQLAQVKEGVVRLRGRWVRADPDRLARLRSRADLPAGVALAAALGGPLVVDGESLGTEVAVEGGLATLAERLRATGRDGPGAITPEGLRAELRPYQASGVAWMAEMAELGLGGVLADDMGLGKTVQLLALHLHRRATGAPRPTLVVCPVSVLGTWAREAARFAPDVPVRRFHGSSRSLDGLPEDAIVLTTYGVVRRQADVLAEVRWGLVAADEAQMVKNPVSRTARALRRIPAGARFALTGTPVENRLVDLWALLDWTTPGLLGSLDRFRREVAGPVEVRRDPEATEALSRLVRPFLLRRRKTDPDIAPDLPPKTEIDQVVGLTVEQASLYRAVVSTTMAEVEAATGMARRGLVLKLLTGLKQICNHPAQYLGQPGPVPGRSGKLDATTELLATVVDEGDAALVFTQYVAMGTLLERHLAGQGHRVAFLHGSVPVGRRQEMVDAFQAGDLDVLVISVKAGGTGLTLTRATHVVHYDRWWNPAVEDQASDRAWRIGQDRPVLVHRMVCEGTVEDRIAELLATKRSLADAVVASGEGWVSELDDDALRSLVDLAEP
ncbi:DEAD/DEAH box helicase [Iamia sp. SCSIO 61187]|uniref:DEAD/DEAH box helicase n=1 Tax=Iamia sp. SCSIO 61187 TaxID=2722752 RepID=UPI001C62BC0E|nr:DEAD/DEAH box helicase [Iamia sp. SCSIO 61187]QYG91245.1 DEAD/DEAH box helicase [Iamia sp. SCSIO 61187]